VHRDDYQKTLNILAPLAEKLGAARITGDQHIVKISLIGVGMRSHSGIASHMFRVLGAEAINIQMIATSEIKVSVIVDEKYLELGVRTLHSAFGLDCDSVEEMDPIVLQQG
jgi:aspartate kinase